MKKAAALIQLARPINFIITFFAVLVAAYLSYNTTFYSFYVLLAAISAGLAASAGNVINDIYDIEIDKINKPHRPLPSGRISINSAYTFYFTLSSVSVIMGLFIHQTAALIVLLANILLFLYSYKLKKIILIGNVTIAFLTGFTFFYGGIAVGNPSGAVIPAGFAFLINLIREVVKDMEDAEGDAKNMRETFPLIFGFNSSKTFILILTVILIIFTFLPFYLDFYSVEYLILVTVTVNLLLIYFLISIYRNHSIENLEKMSGLLKLAMVFGLIALLFANERF
jgi:geranylgeranylglycerol-phosphate geranylgeranyltransferase